MSLLTTTAVFVFLIIAPQAGYPLTMDQAIRILEIILPVFVGYLGSAAQFAFRENAPVNDTPLPNPALMNLLIKGPIIAWVVMSITSLTAFGLSNSSSAAADEGWSVDLLAGVMTIALSLLTVTTHAAVSYLFRLSEAKMGTAK